MKQRSFDEVEKPDLTTAPVLIHFEQTKTDQNRERTPPSTYARASYHN